MYYFIWQETQQSERYILLTGFTYCAMQALTTTHKAPLSISEWRWEAFMSPGISQFEILATEQEPPLTSQAYYRVKVQFSTVSVWSIFIDTICCIDLIIIIVESRDFSFWRPFPIPFPVFCIFFSFLLFFFPFIPFLSYLGFPHPRRLPLSLTGALWPQPGL